MEVVLFNLILEYLKCNSYVINSDELKLQLLSHPSYPSLHSITGVLDHFSIENLALQVPVNLETLEQLPKSFISTTLDTNQYMLITQNENHIEIWNGLKDKRIVSKTAFLKTWSGIVVVVDPNDEISKGRVRPNSKVATIMGGLFLSFLCLVFVVSNPTPFEYVHFILSFIGLGLSFLVLKLDLGYQSRLTDKICNSTKAASCDAVLNSEGATFFKNLKMSDLSIIYFSSLIFSWVLHLVLDQVNSSVLVIGSAAVFITIYTLYYQYRVVKKWCTLCLGITLVLWLQLLGSLFLGNSFISPYNLNSTSILLLCLLTTSSLWMFIKPLLEKQQELEKLKIEHYKFKRNFDVFYALYSKDEFIETEHVNDREIILGQGNGGIQIVLVTSPSCYYCKSAHNDLERLLEKHGDKINLTIRFNVPKDINNPAHRTAITLLQMFHSDYPNFEKALNEAYGQNVNLDNWLKKWKSTNTDNSYEHVLNDEKEWCAANGIHFTPALYVNGKQYPKMYDRNDLQYFIEDLLELNENSMGAIEKAI